MIGPGHGNGPGSGTSKERDGSNSNRLTVNEVPVGKHVSLNHNDNGRDSDPDSGISSVAGDNGNGHISSGESSVILARGSIAYNFVDKVEFDLSSDEGGPDGDDGGPSFTNNIILTGSKNMKLGLLGPGSKERNGENGQGLAGNGTGTN